jgi:hypothetical protein
VNYPGDRALHGDTVQLHINDTVVNIAGGFSSQGVVRDGCGFVELTLPDPQSPEEPVPLDDRPTEAVSVDGTVPSAAVAVPDQQYRNDMEQEMERAKGKRFQYRLYRAARLVYASPFLTLVEFRWESDGALVLTGSP